MLTRSSRYPSPVQALPDYLKRADDLSSASRNMESFNLLVGMFRQQKATRSAPRSTGACPGTPFWMPTIVVTQTNPQAHRIHSTRKVWESYATKPSPLIRATPRAIT